MAAREDLGVAEGSGGRRSAADPYGFNDLGLAVFVMVLPVASVVATISLHWSALVLWPVTMGVVALALRRARDRRSQVAWLEGTVLVVQDDRGVRSCDLTAAHKVDLTYTVGLRGDPSFRVLVARDETSGPVVRFVLRDRAGHSLAPRDLRLLAAALEAPSSSAGARATAGTLREIAEYGRERTSSERVDWSHRLGRGH